MLPSPDEREQLKLEQKRAEALEPSETLSKFLKKVTEAVTAAAAAGRTSTTAVPDLDLDQNDDQREAFVREATRSLAGQHDYRFLASCDNGVWGLLITWS